MTLYHFSVTQIRSAATCPRIHYFDVHSARQADLLRVKPTRVWVVGSSAQTGGGLLFHHVVERFNRLAAQAPEILSAVEHSRDTEQLKQSLLRFVNARCIDTERLAERSVPLRQAFITALFGYFSELSEIIQYALGNSISPRQIISQLFGDQRKRVDVTFHVGDDQKAHVTGGIDYVFFDWRTGSHRIVDYKLTPSDHVDRDLFQVCSYALMHHHQHETRPDVALFYLHPTRQTFEKSWDQVYEERHKVYDLLSSMVGWCEYDETAQQGLKPPGNSLWCASCKWNQDGQCEARLGPKHEGERDNRWTELSSTRRDVTPPTEAHVPSPLVSVEEANEELADVDVLDEQPIEQESTSLAVPSPQTGVAAPAPPSPLPTTEGLVLGRRVSDQKPTVLSPSVINTHIAVVGAAGSGKTWTAKAIVEEVIYAGVPVIAIDPQGDLVQFITQRVPSELPDSERARHQRYLDRVEPRIFTPGTSHGIRLSLNPIRLPSKSDLARIPKDDRRAEEEEALLQAVASNLTSLANVGGEEDSQRAFLYLLLNAIRRDAALQLKDLVQAVTNPEDLGIEDPDQVLKKSEREKLARKLNTFVLGPGKNLFSGGFPLDLDRFLTPNQPGKIPLNVIYLNALTDDDQKHFFLAALASEIYRWMVTSLDATTGKPNLLFYIDEARDFIPAGGRKPAAKEPLIRLFTQGRKYGVGCLLCTQSPRSVDYNVFGNCSTKIIGRMEASQDIDRIKDWFTIDGPAPSWVAARKGAARGTFVGRWPGISADEEGQVFQSRLLYSTHEGAWSPDRVEREVDATGSRDVE